MLQNDRFVLQIDKESEKILLHLVISVTVMRLIVEYIYRTQISVIYNYSSFTNTFNETNFIISLVLMYSLLPFIVRCVKEPCFSNLVLLLIYLINFVPGTILMTYMDLPFLPYWYVYYFLLFALNYHAPPLRSFRKAHNYMEKQYIYILAGSFSLFVLFIWLYYAHGRIQLGLDDLYSIRLEAREFGMPMFLRYIFASMKIVLPIFVVWSLKNRDYWLACIFGFIQLIAFFTDGSKSTLFSLLSSVICYFFLKKNHKRVISFSWVISGIGILSIIEYKKMGSFQISGIFFRRVMFVPQSLNRRYFDFFTNNEPDYFRGSILKIFGFSSPYGSIARTIGKYYTGSNTLAANNGLFSDAFANLGYLGVFLMPVAVVMLLRVLDSYSTDLEIYIIIGSIIPFTIALISASYFTMFLSHGVIALLVIFHFLPRNYDIQERKNKMTKR